MVLEKGGESGDHIVSGAILNPVVLNEVIASWREGLGELLLTCQRINFIAHRKSCHAFTCGARSKQCRECDYQFVKGLPVAGQQAEELWVMLLRVSLPLS